MKYRLRPRVLEDLCLSEFEQCWKVEVNSKSKETIEQDSGSSNDDENDDKLRLLDNSLSHDSRTSIIKRKKEAVIKTPFILHVSNPEAYYYSLILLYLLFRTEDELLGNHTNATRCYGEIFNHLRPMINSDMLKRQEELKLAMDRLALYDNG